MYNSRVLFNEYPLIVPPKLAQKIGLNEAIVLQQIHYWLDSSRHIKDGHKWIYNTHDDWHAQFPFWSKKTVQRVLKKLEDMELVITGEFNKMATDRTKWYTINYQKLAEIEEEILEQEARKLTPTSSNMEVTEEFDDPVDNSVDNLNDTTNNDDFKNENEKSATNVDVEHKDKMSTCSTEPFVEKTEGAENVDVEHKDKMTNCVVEHKDKMTTSIWTNCPPLTRDYTEITEDDDYIKGIEKICSEFSLEKVRDIFDEFGVKLETQYWTLVELAKRNDLDELLDNDRVRTQLMHMRGKDIYDFTTYFITGLEMMKNSFVKNKDKGKYDDIVIPVYDFFNQGEQG